MKSNLRIAEPLQVVHNNGKPIWSLEIPLSQQFTMIIRNYNEHKTPRTCLNDIRMKPNRNRSGNPAYVRLPAWSNQLNQQNYFPHKIPQCIPGNIQHKAWTRPKTTDNWISLVTLLSSCAESRECTHRRQTFPVRVQHINVTCTA